MYIHDHGMAIAPVISYGVAATAASDLRKWTLISVICAWLA